MIIIFHQKISQREFFKMFGNVSPPLRLVYMYCSTKTKVKDKNDDNEMIEISARIRLISSLRESYSVNKVFGALKCSALEIHVSKALFKGREGNPGARVTPARGLPWNLHISFFAMQRVYKAGRVTLSLE